MTWTFGDSFDFYATVNDALLGYWDSGSVGSGATLITGRFTGSQCLRLSSIFVTSLVKSSATNDAVHHFICAVKAESALSGTTAMLFLELLDGTTAQCTVTFRSDGAMLLQSGAQGGTTLATYTGAISAQNTWTAFEIEVVINNSTGSITVRKNGNTGAADFTATSLNTRPVSTNNYANKLTLGMPGSGSSFWDIDDLLWRSDASSVAWLGDVRCYQVMPASDASVQFSQSTVAINMSTAAGNLTLASGAARGYQFVATQTGTIASGTVTVLTGGTGNIKAAIYTTAGALVGSGSNAIVNPGSGVLSLTFATPVPIVRGTTYVLVIDQDFSVTYTGTAGSLSGYVITAAFSGFPQSTLSLGSANFNGIYSSVTITPTNNMLVNEAQQDGSTSYVFDSTVGHSDFYNTAGLPSTPASIFMVTTRGFGQKSDAGSRVGQIQLKSGTTTVQTSNLAALSTNFLWQYRQDLTDPNTGSAWTAVAVNAATIGPTVVS